MRIWTSAICLSVVALIATIGNANLKSKNFATMTVHVCASHVADQRAKADTFLFVGSSRTGAALDPLFIQSRISEQTDKPVTVGRMITWRSDHAYLNLLLRNYLNTRGAPEEAILEFTLHVEDSLAGSRGAVPLPPPSVHAFRYIDWEQFSDAQASYLSSTGGDGTLNKLQTNHLNRVEYASRRITQGFYHFLRNPLGILTDVYDTCNDDARREIESADSGLVFGALAARPEDALWTRQKTIQKPDPSEPPLLKMSPRVFRSQFAVIQNSISILKSAGAKRITLLYVPKIAEVRPHPEFADIVREKFPDVRFVELAKLATEAQRARMESQYRDGAHLTPKGALVASTLIADFLADTK